MAGRVVASGRADARRNARRVGERASRGGGAAVTPSETALREFCARILGYERAETVECALRSIRLYLTHCAALVLLGDVDADLLSVAPALHRRTPGPDRPFVVSDHRRQQEASAVVAAR